MTDPGRLAALLSEFDNALTDTRVAAVTATEPAAAKQRGLTGRLADARVLVSRLTNAVEAQTGPLGTVQEQHAAAAAQLDAIDLGSTTARTAAVAEIAAELATRVRQRLEALRLELDRLASEASASPRDQQTLLVRRSEVQQEVTRCQAASEMCRRAGELAARAQLAARRAVEEDDAATAAQEEAAGQLSAAVARHAQAQGRAEQVRLVLLSATDTADRGAGELARALRSAQDVSQQASAAVAEVDAAVQQLRELDRGLR